MSPSELFPLIQAFEKVQIPAEEVIIKQGDDGDYFYVLEEGICIYSVNGIVVGEPAKPGDSFGELALMYTCPRAATVMTTTAATLFRVDQRSFRYILQAQSKQSAKAKIDFLNKVSFLQDLSPQDIQKLSTVMLSCPFKQGDVIVTKGGERVAFYIVEEGTLIATDVGDGDSKYEDLPIKAGEHFGERAIVTGKPPVCNIVAQTDGRLFTIDKDTFSQVLGNLDDLVLRSLDKRKLGGIKLLNDTKLDSTTLSSLANLLQDLEYSAGDHIFEEGSEVKAAVYLVRSGSVKIESTSGTKKKQTLSMGAYFGDETLLSDVARGTNGPKDSTVVKAGYTVKVVENCRVGVLTLESCRKVFDTLAIGKGRGAHLESITNTELSLADLTKHTILGAGTFGQVWLVSRPGADGNDRAYALKVQSKYELSQSGQARSVVHEKEIMAGLNHPLVNRLLGAFKDVDYIYMLMNLVQGGELYGVMHTSTSDKLSENVSKFYIAGIAEGLGYMHSRGFVYRDLKPENVLISNEGYPVIIDFGFAKYVSDMTYTLCGTPLYLPPEVILNRGHNWGCDHWSLGVLLYEMILGYTPFYVDGMDQIELFRAIVKGKFSLPKWISAEANSLMSGLLTRDPRKRLGSLSGGENDIAKHPFFTDTDFGKIRRMEYPAHYVPSIKNPLDASNFESWTHVNDKLKTKYPKLTREEAKIFDNF